MRVAVALGGWSVCGVWVYTGDRTQWEVSLLKLPRSVDWLILEVGLGIGRKTIVMDYVGCARTVQVTPGRRSALSIVMFTERLGTIRKVTTKVPRSSRAELKVDRELRTSGQTEYGTTCLGRMERLSVVMRWVHAAENYPGQRAVRCKQGIGCWNMQTV